MIYTGLLSLLLAKYAANQKCSAVLLCSAASIYPKILLPYGRRSNKNLEWRETNNLAYNMDRMHTVVQYKLDGTICDDYSVLMCSPHKYICLVV